MATAQKFQFVATIGKIRHWKLKLMSEISANRKHLNEVMYPLFLSKCSSPCRFLDVGISDTWNYRDMFFKNHPYNTYHYYTCDINLAKNPDIIMDVSSPPMEFHNKFNAVVCQGVTEQADNPYKLFEGIYRLLTKNGVLLAGIASYGFPMYSQDFSRFSPRGAKEKLLKNFEIIEESVVGSLENPEYLFYIGRK